MPPVSPSCGRFWKAKAASGRTLAIAADHAEQNGERNLALLGGSRSPPHSL
jgi:hypothetical protein